MRQLAGLSIGIEVSPRDTDAIIADVVSDVGLSPRINDRVDLLSGGQRHRAHLARVLGQLAAAGERNGQYLLLDEPTASLDLVHQIAVMKVARRADEVALLAAGRLVDSGPPAAVFTSEQLSEIYEASIDVVSDPSSALRIFPVFEPVTA